MNTDLGDNFVPAPKTTESSSVKELEKEKRKYLDLSAKFRALAITSGASFQPAKSKAYDTLSKKAWNHAKVADKRIAKALRKRGKSKIQSVGSAALGYLGIEDTGAAWYQSKWAKGAGLVGLGYLGYRYVAGKR